MRKGFFLMKFRTGRYFAVFLAILFLLGTGLTGVAQADSKKAAPINRECELDWKGFCNNPSRLYDSNWKTGVDLKKGATGAIRWKEEQKASLIWWEWTQPPEEGCTFTFLDADGNTLAEDVRTNEGDRGYLFVPEGAFGIRLVVDGPCRMTEWHVYAEDGIPEDIHLWEPAPEKCDIMLVVAHSDDELVMMGGIIPTYVAERGYRVQVVYCYVPEMNRHSEALNGLWFSGMRTLPTFFQITDEHRLEFHRKITEQIRKYRPEVVITHDIDGEYGNSGHVLVSRETRKAVESAANASEFTASAEKYGTWQVKKLYVHLYDKNQIVMDFDTPLDAFDGKTAFEIAQEAYSFHKSQRSDWLKQLQSNRWDCRKYGLYSSTVGEDVAKNDFLENIPPELLSNFVPTPSPVPTDTPEPTDTPAPTEIPTLEPTSVPAVEPAETPEPTNLPEPANEPASTAVSAQETQKTEQATAAAETDAQEGNSSLPFGLKLWQALLMLGGLALIAVAGLTALIIVHRRRG